MEGIRRRGRVAFGMVERRFAGPVIECQIVFDWPPSLFLPTRNAARYHERPRVWITTNVVTAVTFTSRDRHELCRLVPGFVS